MKAVNKILAFILCTVMILGTLVSCNGKGNKIDTNKYTANVEIKFATNDPAMKDSAYAIDSSSVIKVNGDNISVSTQAKTGDTTVNEEYILVDDVLYYGLSVSIGDFNSDKYRFTEFGDYEENLIFLEAGNGAHINNEDFDTVNVSGDDKAKTYICSDISSEAKYYLEAVMNKKLDSFATATLAEATLNLETKDDAPIKSVLSCDYVITMGGAEYTVTMRLYTTYDYECETVVSAPADVNKYESATFDDIFN